MTHRDLDGSPTDLFDDYLDVIAEHERLTDTPCDEQHGGDASARLTSWQDSPTHRRCDRPNAPGLGRQGRTRAVALAAAVLALWLGQAGAAAANDVATAQKIVKDVFGGGNMYRVTERKGLPFREAINTGKESGATFRFIDDTSIQVGENADLKLDEFVFDPARGGLKGAAALTRGALRFVSGNGAKDIAIRTAVGTIGIRGTAFTLRVDGAQVELEVQEGQVSFATGGAPIFVRAGEFISARSGAAVERGRPSAGFRLAIAQIDRTLGPAGSPAGQTASTSKELRDTSGRIAAFLITQPNGRIDGQDSQRRLVAYYDPARRATFRADGSMIGSGDVLAQHLLARK